MGSESVLVVEDEPAIADAVVSRLVSEGFDARDRAPVRHGGLELDHAGHRVRRNGVEVHLTPIEFDLLAHLLARPGVVFSREQLLADVWSYSVGAGPRTVDSHVRAVRRKLGDDVVRTVHGIGYALGLEQV